MTLWRVRATVDDRPGFLSVLTASLALRSVNILSVQVHGTAAGAVDDFLCDAPDDLSEEDLIAAVVRGRGRDPWVRRTEAQHLVDPPTDVLAAAARLVRAPASLADVLAGVLLNASVRHMQLAAAGGNGFTGSRMQIPAPDGGSLLVEREAPPFTPAEYARACVLVDIAAEVAANSGVHWIVAMPDGSAVELRPGVAADVEALAALPDRVSAGSTPAWLRALAAADVVAIGPDGEILGAGAIHVDGDEGEVAVVIADAWQRKGIGTAILRRLIEIAEDAPVAAVHAHSAAGDEAMMRTMGRLDVPLSRTFDSGIMTVTADLRFTYEGRLPRPVSTTVRAPS
jgi:GNAT superfamily N-acetyltransferase